MTTKTKNTEAKVTTSKSVTSPFKTVFDFWPTKWSSFFDFPADPVGISVGGTDENVTVEFEVPGFSKEEVKVTMDTKYGSFSNSGCYYSLNVECKNDKKSAYFISTIPYSVDASVEPEVELKNGILTVTFQRSEKTKPKVLSIK